MSTSVRARDRRPPVDPRLWKYSQSARRYLVVTVALSVLATVAIIASAMLIAAVLAGVITDPGSRDIGSWRAELMWLAVALAARVGATWAQARYGDRAATQVIAELQGEVLDTAVRRPAREVDAGRDDWSTQLTKGIADLHPYLAGYVPALLLSVLVPPTVLVAIATEDLVSAAIVAVTLPLIPVFMVLIGL
ncbi:MAG: cysteine ABC transporter ATP-binding protein, partial [Aldersonia sp.]|nr:cysteine ABC transporter ATP-binding protein [Aldersonia sp.]